MKPWECEKCRIVVLVDDDYKHEYCCSGNHCGCYGMPINPVFCDICEEKIFSKQQGKDGAE